MLAIPEILYEEKYEETWEWDGWKPKAKPNAPHEVKQAIADWLEEAEAEDDEDSIISL